MAKRIDVRFGVEIPGPKNIVLDGVPLPHGEEMVRCGLWLFDDHALQSQPPLCSCGSS